MQQPVDISIVIPLLNEEESILSLNSWIFKVLKTESFSFEIIYIDDGSTDGSWNAIESLSKKNQNVRGIRFAKTLVNLKLYMPVLILLQENMLLL